MIQQFISSDLVLFKVHGGHCHLRAGERFEADAVIGVNTWDNQPIIASFAGQVEAVGYDGSSASLAVLVRRFEQTQMRAPIRLFKVSSRDCRLRLGDRVPAGSMIGRDAESGLPLYSDHSGWVEHLISNCANHTIALLVRAA